MELLKDKTRRLLTIIHIHVHKQRFRKGLLIIIVTCTGAHFVYPEMEGVITLILNIAFFYDPIVADWDNDVKKAENDIKKDLDIAA